MRNNSKNKQGFGLVEVMISITIFSIMSVMISGAFASFLKNYAVAKDMQRGLENAQTAMNMAAKITRQGKVVAPNSFSGAQESITIFAPSSQDCIMFKLDGTNFIGVHTNGSSSSYDTDTECASWGGSEPASDLFSIANIDTNGAYKLGISANASNPSNITRVTFFFTINKDGQKVPIQTSVSLRNSEK